MTPKVRAGVQFPRQPPTNPALLSRTRLDESGVNMLKLPHTLVQGAPCAHARRQYGPPPAPIIFYLFQYRFLARIFFLLSSSLSQTNTVLHPSRIRHNGDTDANMQQGPIPRILFRLRPYVNLFYYLLLIHIPWILSTIERDADVLACGHVRILHVPGHQGLITKGTI